MKRWHMIIDVEQCEDCNNCHMACKDEYELNDWPGYSIAQPRHGQKWMNIMRKERGQYPLNDAAYRPTPCMHCDDAPCVKESNGAIIKRPDGIVIIDPVKAKGQKNLIATCPYGVMFWNEEAQVPQKCTFCAHLIDNEGWTKPRCVQVCPTGALTVKYMEDAAFEEIIKEENLEVLNPEFNTKPTVWYKNLHRYRDAFIAGSVAYKNGAFVDVAKGANVLLTNLTTNETKTTIADMFGDFKIDGLPENSGKYKVEMEFNGAKQEVETDLKASVTLGTFTF